MLHLDNFSAENMPQTTLFPRTVSSIEQTFDLGKALAATLKKGDFVALYGEVGAGKTHIVKGICAYFGINPDVVNSPTFTLVNEYTGNGASLYHFDAYRIEDIEEFFSIGYEMYFYGEGLYEQGICLIEWADKIEALLPPETIRIRCIHEGEQSRRFELF
jgi:tRNA threonylcarbamoyladenosine biosynthesis protein TsaE